MSSRTNIPQKSGSAGCRIFPGLMAYYFFFFRLACIVAQNPSARAARFFWGMFVLARTWHLYLIGMVVCLPCLPSLRSTIIYMRYSTTQCTFLVVCTRCSSLLGLGFFYKFFLDASPLLFWSFFNLINIFYTKFSFGKKNAI